MARHCPVTGEPTTTCECGACDDEQDQSLQREPSRDRGFSLPDDAA